MPKIFGPISTRKVRDIEKKKYPFIFPSTYIMKNLCTKFHSPPKGAKFPKLKGEVISAICAIVKVGKPTLQNSMGYPKF